MSTIMKEILGPRQLLIEGLCWDDDNHPIWIPNSSENFLIKSALKLIDVDSLDNMTRRQSWKWKAIWKLLVIPKVKMFLWRLIQDDLLTKARLQERGWRNTL